MQKRSFDPCKRASDDGRTGETRSRSRSSYRDSIISAMVLIISDMRNCWMKQLNPPSIT